MELSKIIAEILLRYDIKKPIVAPTVQRHGATAGLGKSAKQPSFQGRSCWFLEAHVSLSLNKEVTLGDAYREISV